MDLVNIAKMARDYQERALAAVQAKILEQKTVKPIYSSINELTIPAASTVTRTITADADGDFVYTGITGSFTHAGFPSTGVLLIRITEASSGYSLTQGFVPFHLLFNPGFISATVNSQRFYPTPFNEILPRTGTLNFDIQNTDPAISGVVNILAEGRKVK